MPDLQWQLAEMPPPPTWEAAESVAVSSTTPTRAREQGAALRDSHAAKRPAIMTDVGGLPEDGPEMLTAGARFFFQEKDK